MWEERVYLRELLIKRNRDLIWVLLTYPDCKKLWFKFWVLNHRDGSFHKLGMSLRHELPQPSQQEPGIEMGFPRHYLWRSLLCNEVIPHDIHKRPTEFLRMLYQQNTATLNWRGQREGERKEICLTPKILWTGNKLIIQLSCKHMLHFQKKEEWLQG